MSNAYRDNDSGNHLRVATSLLLDAEWAGSGDDEYCPTANCCPWCGGDKPYTMHMPAKRLDAWTREPAHTVQRGGHKADCPYVVWAQSIGESPVIEGRAQ